MADTTEPQATDTPIPTSVPDIKPDYPPMPAVIAAAVLKTMEGVGYVQKKGYNREHSYKFVAVGDILAKLQPAMIEAGLIIIQEEGPMAFMANGKILSIEYTFRLQHVSGVMWAHPMKMTGLSRWMSNAGGFDDKAINKCLTTAGKYFKIALFEIPSGEADDPDADPAPGSRAQRQEPSGTEPTGLDGEPPMQYEESPQTDSEKAEQKLGAEQWVRAAKADVAEAKAPIDLDNWSNTNGNTLKKLQKIFPEMYEDLMAVVRAKSEEVF